VIWIGDGTGILSGVHDSDAIERSIEEDRRKELMAAQLAADQEQAKTKIEDALTSWLRTELGEEIAARKLSAETLKHYKSDYQRFKLLRRMEVAMPARSRAGRRSLAGRKPPEGSHMFFAARQRSRQPMLPLIYQIPARTYLSAPLSEWFARTSHHRRQSRHN
jgi:hypothetical protein